MYGRIICSILIIGLVITGSIRDTYSTKLSIEKKRLLKIQRELKQKKALLSKVKRKERRIINRLEKINKDLYYTSKKVQKLKKSLYKTQRKIYRKKKDLANVGWKLYLKQKRLGKRLRAIYKYQKKGILDILCTSNNLSDLSRQLYFMTLILQSDIALIEQIRKEKNILAKETQRLQSQHRRYLRIQKEYTKIYQQQQRKKYTQERLLAKIQRDERLYRAQIAQLNKSSKKLTRLIKRLEAQKKIQKNRYRAYPERGRLPWPVTGHVIKKFGKYKHPKFDIYVINKGIDILAPEGRVVKAVSPGKVVYADWFKGYGMLVMIDHGRGLYSLYAHLSDILVRKNQHVTTGTPVGRVGQTGFASRPNLHFELRVDGQPVDPLVWLRKG